MLRCGEIILQRTWRASSGLSSTWTPLPVIASAIETSRPQVLARTRRSCAGRPDSADLHLAPSTTEWASSAGLHVRSSADHTGQSGVDMFCRGGRRDDDDRVTRVTAGSTDGSPWVESPLQSPDAASPGPENPPEVFVRGTRRRLPAELGRRRCIAANLGGICTSGPTATFSGPTRLDVPPWHRHGDLASLLDQRHRMVLGVVTIGA